MIGCEVFERHLDISLRTPEATSLTRATGFNHVQVGNKVVANRSRRKQLLIELYLHYGMRVAQVWFRNLVKYQRKAQVDKFDTSEPDVSHCQLPVPFTVATTRTPIYSLAHHGTQTPITTPSVE